MIVAIDGPSGSGKTTISYLLAKEMRMIAISSGLLYRYVAYYAQADDSVEKLLKSAQTLLLTQKNYCLSIKDCVDTHELYKPEIEQKVSRIAQVEQLRHYITNMIRTFMKGKSCVVEGRDAISAIVPHADLKVFLSASERVRSKRLSERSNTIQKNTLQLMKKRDQIDHERTVSGLYSAYDTVIVDTSDLTIRELCNIIKKLIKMTSRTVIHGT